MAISNIFQWNAQSAAAKRAELDGMLSTYSVHVAFISETWYKAEDYTKFKYFNILRHDRLDGYGGVAIIIDKSIAFTTIYFPAEISNKINICIVYLTHCQFSIVSIYRTHNNRLYVEEYESIFNVLGHLYIVTGDFNTHCHAFGSYKTDNDGRILLVAVDRTGCVFLNDGSAIGISYPQGHTSVVDLTLVSPNLASLADWRVLEDTHSSDHFPIMIKIKPDSSLAHYLSKSSIRTKPKIERRYNLFTEAIKSFKPRKTRAKIFFRIKSNIDFHQNKI